MDDTIFIEWAKAIAAHPWDPYGGSVNWHGIREPFATAARNPPLWGWWLAAIGSWIGWDEWVLHLAQLPWIMAFLFGTHALAKGWVEAPIVVVALVAISPAFLLSSSTSMADLPLSAAWIWAVWAWCRPPTARTTACAALCATCAAMLKWFGIALVPLLVAWEIGRCRKPTVRLAFLLLPVAALVVLEVTVRARHGVSLLFTNVGAVTTSTVSVPTLLRAWIGCSFLAGAAGLGAALLLLLEKRASRLNWILAVLSAGGGVLTAAHLDAWPTLVDSSAADRWWIGLQSALFGGIGALLLISSCRWNRGPTEERILVLWIVGTFLFVTCVNWGVVLRGFLPALPALAICLVRRLDSSGPGAWRCVSVSAALVLGAVSSAYLVFADDEVAYEARDTATTLVHGAGGRTVWFQGHWGFQHYASEAGAVPMDQNAQDWQPHDLLLVPMLNSNVFGVARDEVETLSVLRNPLRHRIVDIGPRSGAGCWGDMLGPLPFAWNLGDVAETWVFEREP